MSTLVNNVDGFSLRLDVSVFGAREWGKIESSCVTEKTIHSMAGM